MRCLLLLLAITPFFNRCKTGTHWLKLGPSHIYASEYYRDLEMRSFIHRDMYPWAATLNPLSNHSQQPSNVVQRFAWTKPLTFSNIQYLTEVRNTPNIFVNILLYLYRSQSLIGCVWEIDVWVLPALLQRLKGWVGGLSACQCSDHMLHTA